MLGVGGAEDQPLGADVPQVARLDIHLWLVVTDFEVSRREEVNAASDCILRKGSGGGLRGGAGGRATTRTLAPSMRSSGTNLRRPDTTWQYTDADMD